MFPADVGRCSPAELEMETLFVFCNDAREVEIVLFWTVPDLVDTPSASSSVALVFVLFKMSPALLSVPLPRVWNRDKKTNEY